MLTVQAGKKQNQRDVGRLASSYVMLMNRTHRTMKKMHPCFTEDTNSAMGICFSDIVRGGAIL
jgi:hypothetical protein